VCRSEAKQRIDALFPAAPVPPGPTLVATAVDPLLYKRRAKELIDEPHELSQGGFGVCGMAAVLHTMLVHDLQAFTDLVDTIMYGKAFKGIQPAEALLPDLVAHHDLKKTYSPLEWDHKADFLFARSLGKLLELANPGVYQQMINVSQSLMPYYGYTGKRPIVLLQLGSLDLSDAKESELRAALTAALNVTPLPAEFAQDAATAMMIKDEKGWALRSKYDGASCFLYFGKDTGYQTVLTFDPGQLSGIFLNEGDLAFNYVGIEALMTSVLRKNAAASVRCDAGVDAAIGQINSAFDTLPKPYVIGFVNGSDAWGKAQRGFDKAFIKPGVPPHQYHGQPIPEAAHIVGITGKITSHKFRDEYLVPTWTWGSSFTAAIPKANFASYLRGFTYGSM
jgi:hypothetical protein